MRGAGEPALKSPHFHTPSEAKQSIWCLSGDTLCKNRMYIPNLVTWKR